MSMLNINIESDRNTLLDFYQLKTLDPKSFKQDTIPSTLKVDLSTEDLSQIPKEVVNHLLGDNMNDLKDTKHQIRPNSIKRQGKDQYSDALGFHQNILDDLIDKDILDDTRDPQLNKFMVDSKLFNPKLFLSVIHSDKSLNQLMIGIKNLENDIESKKPLLQKLITNNFEKTLNSKNSLDKIFNEFSSSNLGNEIDNLNKNLASSNNSANQMLNPILLMISKEQELSNAVNYVKQNKFFIDLPKKLKLYIEEDNFDSVIKEYERGVSTYQQMKLEQKNNALFDKIWNTVLKIINDYKLSMIEDLKKIHIELISSNFKSQINTKKSNFVLLIKRIIELSPDENPIKNFIDVQYQYILKYLDKGMAKINYERLYNARNSIYNLYDTTDMADQFLINDNSLLKMSAMRIFSTFSSKTFSESEINNTSDKFDSLIVTEIWKFVFDYVHNVTEDVISNKIMRFESIVEYFVHDFQETLSDRAKNSSFTFDAAYLKDMKVYFETMSSKICGRLTFLFSCTFDDLTNALKLTAVEGSHAVLPPVGKLDINNPISFGFIPNNTNSISTIYSTVKLFNKIQEKLSQLKDNNLVLNSKDINDKIDTAIFEINKNMIKGCLSLLLSDIRKLALCDNMQPNEEIFGATKLVTVLLNYYKVFISKLHELIVFKNDETKTIIEETFQKSFDLLLEGMIENIKRNIAIDSYRTDYYYLATVYNMRNFSNEVLPQILKSFDTNFQSDLSTKKDLAIFKKIKSYEYSVFVDYMKQPISVLKQIVDTGISELEDKSYGISDKIASGETITVSNYVLKAINNINNLKSKLQNFNIRDSFISDVKASLIVHLQQRMTSSFSVDFSDEAKYQIALDIDVLLILISKYNEKSHQQSRLDTKKFEEAYKSLCKNIDTSSLEKNRDINLSFNYVQFVCFTTL